MSIGKFLFISNVCMSASVGNTINHALPRLHDIEAISRDTGYNFPPLRSVGARSVERKVR
jgi:hypothetical protein